MPGPGARGGDGVGEVAGARTGERRGAELAGGAQGAGDDAVLEGVGRVGGVVLDPECLDAERAAEVVGAEQPGEAGLGVGARLDVVGHGQQRLVAPDVGRPGLDLGAGDAPARLVVVPDLQRPEALRTGVRRPELDLVPALAADQGAGVAEGAVADSAGRVALLGDDVRSWRPPSSSPRRLSPRAGFGTVPATAPDFGGGRRSRRLPGLHRAVPSVPLDEQSPPYRRPSQHAYTRVHIWMAVCARNDGGVVP